MIFQKEGNRLELRRGNETVWIEPWGKDSLRVRATRRKEMSGRDWALMEPPEVTEADIDIRVIDVTEPWYRDRPEKARTAEVADIRNGGITARVDEEGWITFLNAEGKVLTR